MAAIQEGEEVDLDMDLFVDTSTEGCAQYTAAGNRCRALISGDTQCSCRKVGGTDFCQTHRTEVARLTAGYQAAEAEYIGQHTIDNLRRATYASALSEGECRRVLNLLYEETAIRMWSSYVYFNDIAWGMIDARNRNRHVAAIQRREQAITRLEQYCDTDD